MPVATAVRASTQERRASPASHFFKVGNTKQCQFILCVLPVIPPKRVPSCARWTAQWRRPPHSGLARRVLEPAGMRGSEWGERYALNVAEEMGQTWDINRLSFHLLDGAAATMSAGNQRMHAALCLSLCTRYAVAVPPNAYAATTQRSHWPHSQVTYVRIIYTHQPETERLSHACSSACKNLDKRSTQFTSSSSAYLRRTARSWRRGEWKAGATCCMHA